MKTYICPTCGRKETPTNLSKTPICYCGINGTDSSSITIMKEKEEK